MRAHVRGCAATLALLGVLACSAPNPAYHGGSDAARFVPPDAIRTVDARPVGPEAGRLDAPPSANSTLLGYWKLDERTDSPMAADSSGNGNMGILEGLDPRTAWIPGYRGNALDLGVPAVTAGVRVPFTSAIGSLSQFTIAAWTYHTVGDAGYDCIISRQLDDTISEVFNLAFSGDLLTFILPKMAAGVMYVGRSTKPAPINQWVHVAATFDGNNARLYQDGAEVATFPYPHALPATTTPLYIGTNKNPALNEPFNGRLDEVLLYSSVLSPAAIAALASGGVPPLR